MWFIETISPVFMLPVFAGGETGDGEGGGGGKSIEGYRGKIRIVASFCKKPFHRNFHPKPRKLTVFFGLMF